MTFADVIGGADPAGAAALNRILARARTLAPDAEEGVSYGVAALLVERRPLLGLAAVGSGFSLYPFSGQIVAAVADQLVGHRLTKGAIGFTADHPLPDTVIDEVIRLRLAQLGR